MTDVAVVTPLVGAGSPDASTNIGKSKGSIEVHTGTGGAGVIGILSGKVYINDTGAALLTLALPVAGPPTPGGAGGNDGSRLTIISNTAHAHTVTVPANGINGSKHLVTFANVGDSVELECFGGGFLVAGTPTAVVS
jgi:hypothetical protein